MKTMLNLNVPFKLPSVVGKNEDEIIPTLIPEKEIMVKRLSVLDAERCVGCQSCMFACARRPGVGGLLPSSIWVKSAGGIRKGFAVIVCRACPDPPCARVCPTDALPARPGGGVRLHPELCIGCHNCAEACPFGAIFWDTEQDKPEICVYCGYCASYCPCDVLALEEVVTASHGSEPEGAAPHA